MKTTRLKLLRDFNQPIKNLFGVAVLKYFVGALSDIIVFSPCEILIALLFHKITIHREATPPKLLVEIFQSTKGIQPLSIVDFIALF